jgi:hypothetical protein
VEVVPAAVLGGVVERWRGLAVRWPTLVRVLTAAEVEVRNEESAGVAPALAEVVEALPGVALAGVSVDWPQGLTQRWPELGEDRFGYQPVWSMGREAVVVRIGPEGRPGEVLHVRGDGGVGLEAGGVDLVAPDVLTWWRRLTTWAEATLPTLAEELGPEVEGPEELQLAMEQALEEDFLAWLGGVQE